MVVPLIPWQEGIIEGNIALKAVQNFSYDVADGTKAHKTDFFTLQLVAHPKIIRRGPLNPFSILYPLDSGNGLTIHRQDQTYYHLGHSLCIAARGAEDRNTGLGAGIYLQIGGGSPAIADKLQAVIACKDLFRNPVQFCNQRIRLYLKQMLQHFILIVPLTGGSPRLVDHLIKNFLQFGKAGFLIRCTHINLHSDLSLNRTSLHQNQNSDPADRAHRHLYP